MRNLQITLIKRLHSVTIFEFFSGLALVSINEKIFTEIPAQVSIEKSQISKQSLSYSPEKVHICMKNNPRDYNHCSCNFLNPLIN